MANAPICPKCGSIRRYDAPGGVCPACLLKAALGDGAVPAVRGVSHARPARPTRPPCPRRPGLPLRPAFSRPWPVRSDRSPTSCSATPTAAPSPHSIVPPAATDPWPETRYRIDGEIARGGMGAVLKGRDPDLGRDVALKVLREDLRDNADMVRRFVEEAQIGGQLQHPGIVPIYELGTFGDSRPFFSMKLVKGHTLAGMLEDRANACRRPAQVSRHLRVDRPDRRLRTRAWRDPPRPETVKRDGGRVRRSPGDGLGSGQGLAARRSRRRRAGRQNQPAGDGDRHGAERVRRFRPIACRLGDGNAVVHGPRTGPWRDRPD